MSERTVAIWSEFITLGQLLKLLDLVGAGAEVKIMLAEQEFLFNGEPENRRGKKLRPGDFVTLPDKTVVAIVAKAPPAVPVDVT